MRQTFTSVSRENVQPKIVRFFRNFKIISRFQDFPEICRFLRGFKIPRFFRNFHIFEIYLSRMLVCLPSPPRTTLLSWSLSPSWTTPPELTLLTKRPLEVPGFWRKTPTSASNSCPPPSTVDPDRRLSLERDRKEKKLGHPFPKGTEGTGLTTFHFDSGNDQA
jgi:hypothetical protein